MDTENIRELVRAECLKDSNRFGAAFFDQHILVVARYARQLAEKLGADPLAVELAGYLHDLSAVRDMATLASHHLESARIARGILGEHGCAEGLIDRVARAIETHSQPVKPGEGSAEQVCLSNADVLSHIARPIYWCHYLYGVRGFSYEQGLTWLRGRIQDAWKNLTPEARELVEVERAAAAAMLEQAAAQR